MHYDPERITFFAKTDARGQHVPFGIKAKDRTRHVYVIGKTGMGKSTLLENMAVQDIQNGEGLAFIDPHGQTAETLLDYIPEHRKDDVLYFAPFDMQHPVSFNVMEDVGPDKRHLVVSGLMSTFKKIWVDAWSARMEYILSNVLLALLEYPGSTLLGVNRMLSDKAYRELVVNNIKDPAVKSFWVDEFAKYNERYMQEAGDAIKNKIGQFTSNPLIRNIIGQPQSSFDVRKIMDERKILIMNLSKGLIGESNANLLGSMLITRVYLSAMSRADLSVQELNQMPNFYFYVDEFQSFANETFANILSEARKYKLNLTIAHQYIEQMEEEVKNAVFGNVGTIISFRVGPFDAEVLETIFQPKFFAADIVNLGFAQIYLTLMIDGIGSPPFSAVTLPPITPSGISCKDMVLASSRRQFSHARTAVEELINTFHAPVPPKDKPVRTQGSRDQGSTKDRHQSVQGRGNSVPTQKNNPRTHSGQSSPRREGYVERNSKNETGYSGQRDTVAQRPQPQKTEKSLDDLRTVLRTIVGKDTSEQQQNRVPEQQKQAGTEQGHTTLKDALRAVARTAPHETKAKESAAHKESKKIQHQSEPSAADRGARIQVKSSHRHSSPSHADAQKTKHRDVSPKEVERMMRITTNDKSPL